MTDAAPIFEIVRLVLFACEFISDIVVFGVTADKLSHSFVGISFCALSSSSKSWNCSVTIAFAVLAWLALLGLIVGHCLKYLNQTSLPDPIEALAFAGLAVTWFVIAMVGIKSVPGTRGESEVVAVRFFSWINIFLHTASAALAFIVSRGASDKAAPAPAPAPAQAQPAFVIDTPSAEV